MTFKEGNMDKNSQQNVYKDIYINNVTSIT